MPMRGCTSSEHASSISKAVTAYLKVNPRTISSITRSRISKSMCGKKKTEQHIANLIESRCGGFWYGAVKNDTKYYGYGGERRYCELWTEELKERIRAYWGFVSALSGKQETRTNSYGYPWSITCHHIYYHRKACCEWDEDAHGYYVNINNNTCRNPRYVRYYINGDPNKFVTLTASEHAKTTFNVGRIGWIKLFEQLIEDQGGKCYYTKEDISKL